MPYVQKSVINWAEMRGVSFTSVSVGQRYNHGDNGGRNLLVAELVQALLYNGVRNRRDLTFGALPLILWTSHAHRGTGARTRASTQDCVRSAAPRVQPLPNAVFY